MRRHKPWPARIRRNRCSRLTRRNCSSHVGWLPPQTFDVGPSHSPRTTANKAKHLHAKDYALGRAVRVQRSAGVSPAVALGIVPTQGTHKGCPYTDFGWPRLKIDEVHFSPERATEHSSGRRPISAKITPALFLLPAANPFR